jgi:hypothetical protein
VLDKGDFRGYNRVQGYINKTGNQINYVKFLNPVTVTGNTPDACNSFLISVGVAVTGGTLLKSEPHSDNGMSGITPSKLHVFQLLEGRIGPEGQAINMTLNGCTSKNILGFCNAPIPPVTPYIWSYPLIDATGQYTIGSQIFPTYYVYENGKLQPTKGHPQSDLETFIGKNAANSEKRAQDIQ